VICRFDPIAGNNC